MPNPKPLTARQRERAGRAATAHADVLRLQGALDAAREKRDSHIVALLRDGVRPFVVSNETGVPASTLLHLVRRAKETA